MADPIEEVYIAVTDRVMSLSEFRAAVEQLREAERKKLAILSEVRMIMSSTLDSQGKCHALSGLLKLADQPNTQRESEG